MTSTIRTLDQAARYNMILQVDCAACDRSVRCLASDVAQVVYRGTDIRALPLKCKDCGAKASRITPYEYDLGRARDIIVWRPMRLR